MTDNQDGKTPKEPVKRDTFCVRFRGDEKQRLQTYAKENSVSLNKLIREAVLERCLIEPSR